jgi:biopolymer transport protein TolR
MSGRRRIRHDFVDEAEESGELNLVPYLDIITTLVIFLIFTFQVVIEFRLIELLPPAYSATARNAEDQPSEGPTTLTLAILPDGYRLMTNKELGVVEVKRRSDGGYDTEELATQLAKTKANLKLGGSLVLTAANDIEYKVVVEAMDAARYHNGQALFPDVLLAQSDLGAAPAAGGAP